MTSCFRRLFDFRAWNCCNWSRESECNIHSYVSQCTVQVERGTANKGDEVEIVGLGNGLKSTLIGIGEYTLIWVFFAIKPGLPEMFKKELDRVRST